MSASIDSADAADPNLVPLLDVVLQLIMFFMITVNFVRVDQFDDTIDLPVAQMAVPLDKTAEEFIFLNLDGDGKLVGALSSFALDTPGKLRQYLINEKTTLERIARERGKTGEVKVAIVLRADGDCRYGDIWTNLDACQRAGYKRWQLRVKTR
jgi:biopolymer transport protein ExbD